MKCQVCGAESGKYPLCRVCNLKKEQGLIIKCQSCGHWHDRNSQCRDSENISNAEYLYEPKSKLLSASEQSFFRGLKESVPEGYSVFPQINLATFIDRTDHARYRNELFRNVDFLIVDDAFKPRIAVEINDQTHLNSERRERDEKVKNILEEAGIPLLKLWTSYGVNTDYIKGKITESLNNPTGRVRHFQERPEPVETIPSQPAPQVQPVQQNGFPPIPKKKGCYVATCVYGSYDCPQVWALRRYRDQYLSSFLFGKLFIQLYYFVSPTVVRLFGGSKLFRNFWKTILDRKVNRLLGKGLSDQPYSDQ